MADLSITAASVLKGTGCTTDKGIAGATITAGQPVYKDSTDSNKIKLADANASLATAACVGIALHAALAGQPITYATGGQIAIGGTVAIGTTYCLSTTAGGIMAYTDAALTTGVYRTNLGTAITTGILSLKIDPSGVQIP